MKSETGGRIGEGIGRALWWGVNGFWLPLVLMVGVDHLLVEMNVDVSIEVPELFGIGCIVAVSFLCGTLGFWITMARPEGSTCVPIPGRPQRSAESVAASAEACSPPSP
jgi:hypothetical protein